MMAVKLQTQAQQRMTALGDNWWKCIYDGKYHHLGPQVFDQGLHRRQVEPGYFESARKAFLFAKEHLCEKLTVEFYQELHLIACAHFKGKETCTKMTAKDAGRFRKKDESELSLVGLKDFLKLHEKGKEQRIEDYVNGKKKLNGAKPSKEFEDEYRYFEERAKVHFNALIKYIESDPLLKEKGPTLKLRFDVNIIYNQVDEKGGWSFEGIVKELFDEFNLKIAKAASEEERVRLIADLFQKVEWLHPYIDGQGRTDLLFLAWLLCSHGLNPAILADPYVSSYTTLDKWAECLKEGMEAYRREASLLS